jgi:cyclic pyranopterin phosphate synthase
MFFKGTVVSLTQYTAKGDPGKRVQNARFIEGQGMEGDFHAVGGEKQVSLLSCGERQWIESQSLRGLCFGRYKENVLFDGILPEVMIPGVKIAIGGAVLMISDTGKHCFKECPLFDTRQNCILAGRNLFAKVIQSGNAAEGDSFESEEI